MNGTFMTDIFITQMIELAKGVLMIEMLITFQHIVFLEYNTPKQKKTTRIIIGVFVLFTVVIWLIRCSFDVGTLWGIFAILSAFFLFVPCVYSSVTGRKKRSGWACLFQFR